MTSSSSSSSRGVAAAVLLASACFAAALLTAVYVLVGNAQHSRATDRRVCLQVELLKGYVREALGRSRRTLPRIAYYRRHPDELAIAEAQIRDDLTTFKRRAC